MIITEKIHFTPTQQRIMDLLQDGLVHTAKRLMLSIDEQAGSLQLRVHIHNINNKLRQHGWTIASRREMNITSYYLCRPITTSE